jgi:hypothetical protein
VKQAAAFVETNELSFPHEFSYEETTQTPDGRSIRQRVELTLWDSVSVREHAIGQDWSDGGMLSLGSADYRPLDSLHYREGHEFLPYEGIYAGALFGGLMVRMGTITGARAAEIQQIAQRPECFKQLDNVGPKAATRWILRLIPKGRRERANYYIDEDTKNHLAELIRFQCERLGENLCQS